MKKLVLTLVWILLVSNVQKVNQIKTIEVQPYVGMSDEYVKVVEKQLRAVYPKVIVNTPINYPVSAKVNGRYRSDSLLKYLRKHVTIGNKIIGLTDKDITCPHHNSKDWGVFGYGDMPGIACVASSFRLNKSNKAEQLSKTVIHELGHTFGLNHCPTTGCIMSDAKGKNNIDKEKSFCKKCRDYLLTKNWTL